MLPLGKNKNSIKECDTDDSDKNSGSAPDSELDSGMAS